MSPAVLIFTMFLVAESVICCSGEEVNAVFGCSLRERSALLEFKASLFDPHGRLSSWNSSTDCCEWQGVKCDNVSGYVIGLDLQNKRYNDQLYYSSANMLHSGKLDSSILDLEHLSFLDLSGNDFHLTSIPSFLGSMGQMQHLNLSSANFSGGVPRHLGNLSFLTVLDLSYNGLHQLIVDDFSWVSHLSLLTHLNMSTVDLSRTNDLLKVFNMLPSVVDLRFSSSRLENRNLQHACVNSTLADHIEYLDLSDNIFHGELPCFLQNMSSLRYLLLASNDYNSCNLVHLAKLTSLVQLDLGYNSLQCNLDSISESIFDKSHLEYLSLDNNHISGSIPTAVGNLSALRKLCLNGNRLSGEVPVSLGQLSNLEVLYLSDNHLDGMMFESHFATLSKLKVLRIGNNSLKSAVRSDWIPPFQLYEIEMRSCEVVEGQFPQWLQMQKELQSLDMSNCSISGRLPNWLWYNSMRHLDLSGNGIEGAIPDLLCDAKPLRYLDLSRNRLSGNLPDCWANLNMLRFLSTSWNNLSGVIPSSIGGAYSLEWLQLGTNRFTGELPPTLKNCTALQVLDVGENLLSGKVPEWIGNYLLNLKVLRLRCNEFNGTIPSKLCQLSGLQILDLGNNRLTGNIPHCYDNFTYMVLSNSTIQSSARNGLQLMIKGEAVIYFVTLKYVVYMDLSNNSLVGEIPVELTRLAALHFLNLSHNHLQGDIPQRIGDMKSLESLDLSNNHLSGNIPQSFACLTFLSRLNLSYNNLIGEIPTGYQLQTLGDTSIYEGNSGLCGAPLPMKCQDDSSDAPNSENDHDSEGEEDKAEKIWLYGIVISGFATGFWGAIGVLLFKKGWRYVYFKFTDDIIARIIGV